MSLPPTASSTSPQEGASPDRDFGELLRTADIYTLIARPTVQTPHSPLYTYVQSKRDHYLSSPALSIRSDDSLDSILSISENASTHEDPRQLQSAEELETNSLIYKLCRSLYKKVLQKTDNGSDASGGRRCGSNGSRHRLVSVDAKREKNMSYMTDWMPLLHLFDPKTFYAYHDSRSARVVGPLSENPITNEIARNPHEASQQLIDELNVEKLSGGNSNHVYRLASEKFPDKVILLRVYGSGDDEAIDRLRDVAAMKLMSRSALSPAVLHTFKWGRVEEFMDGIATCTTDMLLASPSLLPEVYLAMAEMHRLPYEHFLPETMNRLRLKGTPMAALLELESFNDPEMYCHEYAARMRAILVAAKATDYYHDSVDAKVLEEICPSALERASLRFLRLASPLLRPEYRKGFVRFMCAEIMSLRAALQRHGVPLVFSHNDLNPGNLLLSWRKVPSQFRAAAAAAATLQDSDYDEADEVTSEVSTQSSPISRKFLTRKGRHRNLVELKGVVFIDFEYSDVNYRCFDLGNTLCELDFDYSRGMEDGGPGFIKYLHTFPPEAYRDAWAALPMEFPRLPQLIYDSWRAGEEGVTTPSGRLCLQAISAYFQGHDVGASLSSLTVNQITEVFLGMLASHMHWALWSFVLACNPDQCTNNTDDNDSFARGSSGLDYLFYGNCRLREYFSLKAWMMTNQLL